MGSHLTEPLIAPNRLDHCSRAREFWKKFQSNNSRPKLVFGCNVYSESIMEICSVDGFIDDFAKETTFRRLPIIKASEIPSDALVLVASGGRPLTVRNKLDFLGVEHLDYFSLFRWCGAPLRDVVFNENFCDEYLTNEREYHWIYRRLNDDHSRHIFKRLINFRFHYDLDFMLGFWERQNDQYFEEFLGLNAVGEVFADVGAFDGSTTLKFMEKCPQYQAVYAFEPDPSNFLICERRLSEYSNVRILNIGVGRDNRRVSFATNGSTSGISFGGELVVQLNRLDNLLPLKPTFVKMDIEGGEFDAVIGAETLIRQHQPRMALCVYHKPGDFWRIPKQVLSINPRYDVYLRHYTESIYETVMFFVPSGA